MTTQTTARYTGTDTYAVLDVVSVRRNVGSYFQGLPLGERKSFTATGRLATWVFEDVEEALGFADWALGRDATRMHNRKSLEVRQDGDKVQVFKFRVVSGTTLGQQPETTLGRDVVGL